MSAAATPAVAYKVPKRRHPVLQFILQQPLGAGGLAFIVLMAVCAAAAPLVAPYDPLTVDYGAMLAAPCWYATRCATRCCPWSASSASRSSSC